MTDLESLPISVRIVRSGVRLMAIVAAWIAVVGSGTALFWAPRASEGQPVTEDLVAFGCALAIAGAVAAAITLLINGQRKWAAELGVAVALAITAAAAVGFVLLWVDPWTLRNHMDTWSFLRLRNDSTHWVQAVVLFETPFAASVGGAIGLIGGLLIRWARSSPRWASIASLGLLLMCAIDGVRESLLGFLTGWGWTLYVLFGTPWMASFEISATGAALGALAGTATVGLLIYMTRRTPRARRA